jgi:hypothetical protein
MAPLIDGVERDPTGYSSKCLAEKGVSHAPAARIGAFRKR